MENKSLVKERIHWIDIAKGIGILLVIIGHITENREVSAFIYSFSMPLFFILSGMLYKEKDKFVRKKAKTILIPYFTFAIISYIYWVFVERNLRTQDINPIRPLLNIIIGQDTSNGYIFNVVLWFLPCLFITEVVFNFLVKHNRKKYCMPLIIVFMTIIGYIYSVLVKEYNFIRLPFSLDVVFTAIGFYAIGYYFNKISKKLIALKNYKKIILCIICFSITLIISQFIGGINMMNLNLNYYIVTYIQGVSGFFFIFFISVIINNNKIIEWLGKNSLIIMCIHEPVKRIIIGGLEFITNIPENTIKTSLLLTLIVTFIIVAIIIPCVYIINNYLYFLLGKNKNEEI